MLNRLAILGLLVLINGAWSQVPWNGSGQHDKAKDKQETTNPSKPVVAVDSQHGANNQEQAHEKPTKYPWGELLAPANVPNWFLVVVGGVTGLFVYKTLRAIKKQADIMEAQANDARESGAEATRIALATAQAARKSADAAFAQIEMVKSKERAFISIEFREPKFSFDNKVDGYPIHFRVTMDGSTRAEIINDRIIAYVGELPEARGYWVSLGLPQTFRPEDSPFDGFTLIRTSDDIADIETDAERLKMVREKRLQVFATGRIQYRDLFGDTWERGFDRGWNTWDYYGGEDTRAGIWSKNGNGDYHRKVEKPPTPN